MIILKPNWHGLNKNCLVLPVNAIRPVTVGRKNWLFSDTADGAKANALYLTIVEMAKTYLLNLYKYLKFLFDNQPNKDMTEEEFENLTHWNEQARELCK